MADSVIRWHLVEYGLLPPSERLSPRYLWMAAKEMRAKLAALAGDDSWRPATALERAYTSLKMGLEVARRYGVALERDVPWTGGLHAGDVDAFYAGVEARRLRRYYALDEHEPAETLENWREWMNERGPVLVRVGVDERFAAADRAPLDAFDADAVIDRHAAAIVGYTREHVLIRSSWGTDWGRDGYVLATHDYAAGAIEESYGVVV